MNDGEGVRGKLKFERENDTCGVINVVKKGTPYY